ncbi:MAG: hypothetical protein ABIT58_09840 [Ferruginibacter sp.]
MKKKLKILITGPVPPPAGGISIHIQRLTHLLENDFDIDLIDESNVKKDGIYNMRSLKIFVYLKKVAKSDILFVQSGNRLFKKIHILTGRLLAKKVIITIHGYGARRKQPFRAIDSIFFSLAHKIILVNGEIAGKVPLQAGKCIVKHAFLPPVMKDEPALPFAILNWLTKAKSKKEVIICANASRLDMHKGQDLYGLDMTIEAAGRLVKKGLPVSFVYTVSSLENCTDYFNKNLQLIADLQLQDHFMLISEKLSFVRLIENTDIVIRPTNTDGDALTVREAIFLGKASLASDVVERPAGTILFKTRDITDLENKLEEQVKKIKSGANDPLGAPGVPAENFKAFYADLMNSIALG